MLTPRRLRVSTTLASSPGRSAGSLTVRSRPIESQFYGPHPALPQRGRENASPHAASPRGGGKTRAPTLPSPRGGGKTRAATLPPPEGEGYADLGGLMQG